MISFNLRKLDPERWKAYKHIAVEQGISMRELVSQALEDYEKKYRRDIEQAAEHEKKHRR